MRNEYDTLRGTVTRHFKRWVIILHMVYGLIKSLDAVNLSHY